MIQLRRLQPADAREYRLLRLFALQERAASFGGDFADESGRPLIVFEALLERTPGNFVYGVFEGEKLVGVVRLVRAENRKERHKAAIHGLYVAPRYRRRGFARRLLRAALDRAKKMNGLKQIKLDAIASNEIALRLYEKLGFQEYGRAPHSLRVDGKFHAEVLLVKFL